MPLITTALLEAPAVVTEPSPLPVVRHEDWCAWCITCKRYIDLEEMQRVDETIHYFGISDYLACPTCNQLLVPF